MARLTGVLGSTVIRSAFAATGPASPGVDINTPSNVTSTICGEIVNLNLYEDDIWFWASDAFDCLTSLPFLPDVGSRFISWYNDTLQFHAARAYLREPPASYQQPAVDIAAGLRTIQNKINAGYYKNQYAFEVEVQALTQQTHDTHLQLWGGALYAFSFSSPFYISTVSTDGHAKPKTYIWDDLVDCGTGGCAYSAIAMINNSTVTDYLTDFAKQYSIGYVEPEADWSNLVYTPAQGIALTFNGFSGASTFYPGDELDVTFENGTVVGYNWLALYNSPGFTGPLATAGDFYNFFVLGLAPANFNETYNEYVAQLNDTDTPTQELPQNLTSWNSVDPAYPADTISYQADLGLNSPGYITGYLLKDISTAVLSIPSFDEYDQGISTFSTAVIDFLANATASNATKVIIDLQQNMGGQVSLAYDVMRLFFPQVSPFSGSRRRSFAEANLLGDATTRYFNTLNTNDSDYYNALDSEWTVTDLINAKTGKNFTSWHEYYGPLRYVGDDFSLTQRYNLSSELFDNAMLGIDFPACYYNDTCGDTAPFAGKDIILLTDGQCTSTCSLFVEMMTRDAGAHTVVVGGRPDVGPMQAASGSRGARAYSRTFIDYDIAYAASFNTTINDTLVQYADSGMSVTWAGFTLRDQIRANNTTPNQFLYLPADCRLYWSLANYNDYSRLWHDAWNGIYNDTSICVPGSRNVKEPPKKHTARDLQKTENKLSLASFVGGAISATKHYEHDDLGILDATGQVGADTSLVFCELNGKANPAACPGQVCRAVNFPCLNNINCPASGAPCKGDASTSTRFVCEKKCQTGHGNGPCGGNFGCRASVSAASSKRAPSGGKKTNKNQTPNTSVFNGFCEPPTNTNEDSCAAIRDNAELQELVRGSKRRR